MVFQGGKIPSTSLKGSQNANKDAAGKGAPGKEPRITNFEIPFELPTPPVNAHGGLY